MKPTARCPTHEELLRMSTGDMPASLFEEVCQHVEACEHCQHRLSELEEVPDDFTLSLAKFNEADLARARIEMEVEAHETATSIRDFFSLGSRPSDKQTTLTPPCLLGPYEITRLIGHGGMGEVYEARHTRLDRRVAIKLIRGNRQEDPVSHAHFLREMATAGKFDHPNLVRAHDAWEENGCLYLVMELLEGETVQNQRQLGVRQTLDEILEIMLGLCKALEHLHANGLVHCDVKPANIMRLQNGSIKLIDYGLALSPDLPLSPGKFRAGTKGYMSPEQLQTLILDHRTDIYSAGQVLSFLLSQIPESEEKVTKSEGFKRLEQIAGRMTKANADERYPSASAVIADLQQIQESMKAGRSSFQRKGGIWLSLAILLSLVSWQVVVQIDRDATLVVRNQQPNDVLILTSENGSVRSIALGDEPGISVSPVTYRLTLKSPENRILIPGSITAAARDQVTVVIAGERKPFELKMVEIPVGRFVMGAVEGDKETRPNELPRRSVEFTTAWMMSAYEITVSQFREFVSATGYLTEAEKTGEGGWKASSATTWGEQIATLNWASPGYAIADTMPVTLVTYADALAFCEWLSQREGQRYRLPTEAEWEYACRAGTTTVNFFPFETRDSYCWSLFNAKETVRPRPVGTRQPNPWGYDICGNVREWCQDWYADKAYDLPIEKFPAGPVEGTLRVIRGGCFIDMNPFMRSSHRGYLLPTQATNNQGFRVVKELR